MLSSNAPIRIAGLVIILVSLSIAFPLYFAGYVPRNAWNKNAIQSQCLITDNNIVAAQCPYLCNCTHLEDSCMVCYQPCYQGLITADVNDILVDLPIYEANLEADVVTYLDHNYPIDSTIECYYNGADPADIRLSLDNDAIPFLAMSALFFSIACAIALLFIVYAVVYAFF